MQALLGDLMAMHVPLSFELGMVHDARVLQSP